MSIWCGGTYIHYLVQVVLQVLHAVEGVAASGFKDLLLGIRAPSPFGAVLLAHKLSSLLFL